MMPRNGQGPSKCSKGHRKVGNLVGKGQNSRCSVWYAVCVGKWRKTGGGGSVIEWGYPEAALLIANSGLLGEALQKNLDVEDHCEQEKIFYALSLALVVASHVPENHVQLLVWQPGRTCVEGFNFGAKWLLFSLTCHGCMQPFAKSSPKKS